MQGGKDLLTVIAKYVNYKIPSLTYASLCDSVCVTIGGDTNGEVHIRRDYVWRKVQHRK